VAPEHLVAVVGATGTGKSALALDLAEELVRSGRSAEIIGADAMQLYRGMDIGTAKVPAGERRGIRHHLLDVLEVADEASVADYQAMARAAVDDVVTRGGVPILVGGSGLYVSSVLYDFRFPPRDAAVRARLEADLGRDGVARLAARLRALDPVAADAIGDANGRRIVRALEVVELTGEPFGSGLPDAGALWRPTVAVGLAAPRAELVARLDARVVEMWRRGIVDEVSSLLPRGLERGVTASRAIGYAQAIDQLHGRSSEPEAIERTAALTRRYARRQVGWFRRYPDVAWFPADADGAAAATAHVLARLPGLG